VVYFKGNFSFRHRVQTCSGVQPASHPVGTWGKAGGGRREADHLLPPRAEVKKRVELYLHFPIRLRGVVLIKAHEPSSSGHLHTERD
jgi:hypothetical protein